MLDFKCVKFYDSTNSIEHPTCIIRLNFLFAGGLKLKVSAPSTDQEPQETNKFNATQTQHKPVESLTHLRGQPSIAYRSAKGTPAPPTADRSPAVAIILQAPPTQTQKLLGGKAWDALLMRGWQRRPRGKPKHSGLRGLEKCCLPAVES